ncbi:uncharacterized protein PFL1_04005 [Pseudozyma flocculosa PF-1]|uniref:Uncharacterized protein n=2 Tax=Pseudozyma flocculosa TaxID=84751 RepID=A0A5C3EZQ8_9BASI|nr:uncharacterized protein PFL1_04005 [Pseudozyma flocculosa PF-1]EPQ28702.1 hypothetical protein PFL1_04005 [Pseudozyma flocculosa PF-1]SPO36659.1 uncharacterized protein PSFLO_02130 [Pseudozyma flocculosa]
MVAAPTASPTAASAHCALLSHLFSTSALSVHVPSASRSHASVDLSNQVELLRSSQDTTATSITTIRETAYYDENLGAIVALRIPTSAALPPPPPSTPLDSRLRTSGLPLPLAPPHVHHGSAAGSAEHDDAAAVPRILSTLLFCLHVALRAEYVPLAQIHAASQPSQHSPFDPLPTVHRAHAPYQLQHPADPRHPQHQQLQQHSGQSHPVGFFAAACAGNKGFDAPKVESDKVDRRASHLGAHLRRSRGYIAFDGEHWTVRWLCDVPVTFASTPFVPVLSLTAALTLRLSPPLLDNLLSDPLELANLSAHAFSHSLLSPLHQGPVYPDESTSERLIRMRNSSALGLDGPRGLGSHLTQLGKEVLGGSHTLVTPRSGLEGLKEVERRRKRMLEAALAAAGPDPNGASAGASGNLRSDDGDGDLGGGSSHRGGPGGGDIVDDDSDGDGRDSSSSLTTAPTHSDTAGLQVLKRSARTVLDVKSGLGVRMRTLFTPFSPFSQRVDAGSDLDEVSGEGLDEASLVLCVELENPSQSGLEFDVQDIEVRVEQVSGEARAVVRLLEGAPVTPGPTSAAGRTGSSGSFPVRLEQGQQRNLLYYLSVEDGDPTYQRPAIQLGGGNPGRMSSLPGSGKRNVAIIVKGRPIMLGPSASPTTSEMEPFDSKWNCVLDLSPLFNCARRRANVSRPFSELSLAAPRYAATPAPSTKGGNASRPASQQVYPPTAGSVRHSALALEEAYQVDRSRNLDKLAASGSVAASNVGVGGARGAAATNPRLAAMGNAMGRSLSFGPSVAAGAGQRGPNDPVMARSGSSGTIPQRQQQQQQQRQQIGRGHPPPLSLSTAGVAGGMSRQPSGFAAGEMTPGYPGTPRSASFRLGSAGGISGGGGGLLYKARQRAISAATTAAAGAGMPEDSAGQGRSRTVMSIGQEWGQQQELDSMLERRPSAAAVHGYAGAAADPSTATAASLRTIRPWSHANAHADPNVVGAGQHDGILVTTTILPPRPPSLSSPSSLPSLSGSSSTKSPDSAAGQLDGVGEAEPHRRQSVAEDLTFTSSITANGQEAAAISTGEKLVSSDLPGDVPGDAVGAVASVAQDDVANAAAAAEGGRWKHERGGVVEIEVALVNRHRGGSSALGGADGYGYAGGEHDGGDWSVVVSWDDASVASVDTGAARLGGKLLDSEGIKQRYLWAQPSYASVVPVENHVALPLSGQAGSTNGTTMKLVCLSSGYVVLPDLVVQVYSAGHAEAEEVRIQGLGAIFVD